MAEKIRVVKKDAILIEHSREINLDTCDLTYKKSYKLEDTLEIDLDQFYKDYRHATWMISSDGKKPTPTEFFWEWIKEQKDGK